MDQWSTLFTVAAIVGVAVVLGGAWLGVRALRARRSASRPEARDEGES